MVDRNEPPENVSDRRFAAIHHDLHETRVNLTTTIGALLERGQRLDVLVERSGDLAEDAAAFRDAVTPTSTAILRHVVNALGFLARLATCNCICRDVYEVFVDETPNYTDVRRDIRYMRR